MVLEENLKLCWLSFYLYITIDLKLDMHLLVVVLQFMTINKTNISNHFFQLLSRIYMSEIYGSTFSRNILVVFGKENINTII